MCEHALLDDGLLDLMIVPDVPYDQALALLRELLAPPPHVNYQSVIYRQVPWVEISSEAGLYMNLDGEPLRAETFRFEILPARCVHSAAGGAGRAVAGELARAVRRLILVGSFGSCSGRGGPYRHTPCSVFAKELRLRGGRAMSVMIMRKWIGRRRRAGLRDDRPGITAGMIYCSSIGASSQRF